MRFLAIYTYDCATHGKVLKRFLEERAAPPAGVTLVERWHDVGGGRGFTLFDADDAGAIASWNLQWSDIARFEVIPVLEDSQARTLLSHSKP